MSDDGEYFTRKTAHRRALRNIIDEAQEIIEHARNISAYGVDGLNYNYSMPEPAEKVLQQLEKLREVEQALAIIREER